MRSSLLLGPGLGVTEREEEKGAHDEVLRMSAEPAEKIDWLNQTHDSIFARIQDLLHIKRSRLSVLDWVTAKPFSSPSKRRRLEHGGSAQHQAFNTSYPN